MGKRRVCIAGFSSQSSVHSSEAEIVTDAISLQVFVLTIVLDVFGSIPHLTDNRLTSRIAHTRKCNVSIESEG